MTTIVELIVSSNPESREHGCGCNTQECIDAWNEMKGKPVKLYLPPVPNTRTINNCDSELIWMSVDYPDRGLCKHQLEMD